MNLANLRSLSFWRRPPSARLKLWLAAMALAVIGCTTAALIQDVEERPRTLALALVPEEVQELSKRSGYPVEDIWERVRTIGISSALLRPQALSVLIDRGDALHFSRAEAQKWIMAGLVAPTSPLRPNALWVRDRDIFAHVVRASAERNVIVSTQSLGNVWIVNFPDSIDLPSFPIGFDPAALRSVMTAGLMPVFEADEPGELAPLGAQVSAAMGSGEKAIYILGSGLWRLPAPNAGGFNIKHPRQISTEIGHLAGQTHLAILSFGASDGRRHLRGFARELLLAGYVRAMGGMSPVWRSVLGRRTRLLIIHLSPERDVEENMDRLRMTAAELRSAGISLELKTDSASLENSPSELMEIMRYLFAILFAVLGTLMAMRQGLQSLRRVWAGPRWRQAAPVPQVMIGVAMTTAVSLAASSVVYALLSFDEWRLGLLKAPWFLWTTAVPISVSALAFYVEDIRQWSARIRRPMTYRGALILTAFAAGGWLLLSPRQVAQTLDIRMLTVLWNRLPSSLWWLGPRWREIFVGYPCLTIGLWLYYRHILRHSGHKEGPIPSDPRPWFVAALLGPSGTLQMFGYARAPYGVLVAQTVMAVGLGLTVGAMVLAIVLAYRWTLKKMVANH